MSVEPMVTHYLVTRRCPLRCSYCGFVRPVRGYNEDAWEHELDFKGKKMVLETLKRLGSGFVVIMGGEVLLLGDELVELVRNMNRLGLSYAVQSSSVGWLMERYFDKLVDAKIMNWTISFDVLGDSYPDDDVTLKTNEGFKWLLRFKEAGVRDLVATITITHYNLKHVPAMVQFLNRHGIWSYITTLHWSKGHGYDFASNIDTIADFLPKPEDRGLWEKVMKALMTMKHEDYLIHNELEWFEMMSKGLPSMSWRCKYPLLTPVVDSDGTVRTCLHIRGSGKYFIWDLLDNDKISGFLKMWERDVEEYCKGCDWDCRWHAEYYYERDMIREGLRAIKHVTE